MLAWLGSLFKSAGSKAPASQTSWLYPVTLVNLSGQELRFYREGTLTTVIEPINLHSETCTFLQTPGLKIDRLNGRPIPITRICTAVSMEQAVQLGAICIVSPTYTTPASSFYTFGGPLYDEGGNILGYTYLWQK